jgi:hypothetical protein
MKLLITILSLAIYSCGNNDSGDTGAPAAPAVATEDTTLAKTFVGDYKMECNGDFSAVTEVTEARVKTVLTVCGNVGGPKEVKTDYAYQVIESSGSGSYKVSVTGSDNVSKVYVWSLIDNVFIMGNAQLRNEAKFLKQ